MRATKDLVLYKRHTSKCPVMDMTDLTADAKRFYMDCECPIWVVGRTPNGHQIPRQTTGTQDLALAQAHCKKILAKSNAIASAETAKQKTDEVTGPTVAECAAQYLESRRHELSDSTFGQYRRLLRQLVDFCLNRGIHYIRDLKVDLLEIFKVEGFPKETADTTKATAIAKLRCFLRTAYRREWIQQSLAERVMPHKARYEEKSPYTDDEVKKILDEVLNLKSHGANGYAKHPKTFQLLLKLMLETGMRVGDAIRYDPVQCVKDEEENLWVYTFKPQKQKKAERQKDMEVYIPEQLKKAIDKCIWLSPTKPFYFGSPTSSSYLSGEVYNRMQTVGSRCGVSDCRPHRLRDTFAVRKLLAGLHLDDVSRLLGHSSVRITELYYARWVPARKARLRHLLAETLVDS